MAKLLTLKILTGYTRPVVSLADDGPLRSAPIKLMKNGSLRNFGNTYKK